MVIAIPVGITAYDYFGGAPGADPRVIDAIPAAPTAEQVGAMDKTEAFYAFFARAAQEPRLVVTSAYTLAEDGYSPKGTTVLSRSGFDYESKVHTYATEEQLTTGELETRIRCYDGAWYHPTGRNGQDWAKVDDEPLLRCQKERDSGKVNDGLNTGGLTEEQAETFVGTLRDQDGLITVQGLELVEHKGKPYLHFSVVVTPVPAPSKFLHFGGGWFMLAFQETGLDPTEHVYGIYGAEGDGAKFEYYVDPATKLPAYSEFVPTGTDDEDKPVEGLTYRTRYQFGTADAQVEITNTAPLSMEW